jgi:hypothetical protein
MTIKSSGPISASEVQAEIGTAGTQNARFSFLRDYGLPSFTNIGGVYNKAWYLKTNQGNCDSNPAAPAAATSTGNKQCTNCTLATVNCANCQTQNYLQDNCNCACTYNCTATADQSYNCDCNCNCNCLVCACACW